MLCAPPCAPAEAEGESERATAASPGGAACVRHSWPHGPRQAGPQAEGRGTPAQDHTHTHTPEQGHTHTHPHQHRATQHMGYYVLLSNHFATYEKSQSLAKWPYRRRAAELFIPFC